MMILALICKYWWQARDHEPTLYITDEYPGHNLPGGRLALSLHEEWLATAGRDGRLTFRQIAALVRLRSASLAFIVSLQRLVKFNFTNRVIPIWNSLPNHVVSANTINTFKNRLDKLWSDQEVLYDYNTDLHGIGNRSLL